MHKEVLEKIQNAEMILVGIGEEFDETRLFSRDEEFQRGKALLEETEHAFLIPLLERYYLAKKRAAGEDPVRSGLSNLAAALEEKNYFVVSTSVNSTVDEIPWKEGRLVMPCGSDAKKQCVDGCKGGVLAVPVEEREKMLAKLPDFLQELSQSKDVIWEAGSCPECGKPLQLNNIYHSNYDEKGYLDDWQRYTKWLQGTLNHRLLILELGVGMQFPSVIRWPFEKVAFFNQKAEFYRINENLYQLTEELAGKGTSIAENVIDWLQNLC